MYTAWKNRHLYQEYYSDNPVLLPSEQDEDNRTPPSFLTSIKELLQEGHLSESQDEVKALGRRHDPAGNIYKICYNSTMKRSRATVEDVTPGIHTAAQYSHSDRGWAEPTIPDGIHTDYLLHTT